MDNALSTPSNKSVALADPSSSFKYRRVGRCPSPPVWGCYELNTPENDSDSQSQSDSDDDEAVSIIVAAIDPANIPLPPSPIPVPISVEAECSQSAPVHDGEPEGAASGDSPSMETPIAEQAPPSDNVTDTNDNAQGSDESCNDCSRPKLDKGKGREIVIDSPPVSTPTEAEQCSPPTPSSRVSRRLARNQNRTPKYQPILTIRSSHGWIWNQELFIPYYMKDRYISYPPDAPSSNDTPGIEYDCVGITLTADDLAQVLPP
ncbi:hypothetical protein FRC14_005910 [Serendipita sp. 396]|nr:hypothetical protein FRC14_005910 [Serendipita sp. 396]KAG8779838.1 hypothetical protein FRC15_009914 [Serendipita sp. 397]KAG8800393.1 hypothetical protein FRC16_003017 [Serendipita sp. 398]KAG8868038.1 hypothetical protein FRC20_004274 [Serendipita sp. 405]